MREVPSLFSMILLYGVTLSHSLGINHTGDSNFQLLLGDVELGPLSQRPELFKVAAIQNELVNVTDDQQTAVVTVGVNIRLDWSSWVTEVLGADSALNATYTYYRTQLNVSGSATGLSHVLQPSEHITIRANEEQTEFYVEITCAIVAAENESDRAIYELEACIFQPVGSQRCYRSNITVYAIERPQPLLIHCFGGASGGVSFADCTSDNPIVLRTCTVEGFDTSTIVPCNNTRVMITTRDYQPGEYTATFNLTDIYGQTGQSLAPLFLSEPLLSFGLCELTVDGLNINCRTSLDDHMVVLNYICSYDGGPPIPCSRNITIDKASFTPGFHSLRVTFMTGGGQSTSTQLAFQGRFGLICTGDENRTLTIQCEGIGGVVNGSEVACVYDSGPMQEKCELPVTIDFIPYDNNPGYHNITIIVNSTLREVANYTRTFLVPDLECVQLSEPGKVTVICQIRVMLDRDMQPLCLFDEFAINVPCDDISNIVVVPSEIRGIDGLPLPTNLSFFISTFDPMGTRIRTTLQIHLTEDQPVECSTTVNCSSSSTLMSARECCVNSADGLSYSIPGQEQCHTCIVFGWFQDSFIGLERDAAYNLSAGYLKGAEQAGAGARLMLNVMTKFSNARMSDISLETTRIKVRPMGDPKFVVFTLVADEVTEVNESLTLQLVPTPATLQTMPVGEGVFFKHEIPLTIMDADRPGSASMGMDPDLIGGVVGAVLSVLIMGGIVALVVFCFCYCYHRTAKTSTKKINHSQLWEGADDYHLYSRANSGEERTEISVKSSFHLNLPPHLIFPSSSIKLNETIGHGEFGIVYKGYIKRSDSHSVEEYLAIKTLKGFYDHNMVKDMLKECSRMSTFDHLHVLTLKGVCLDGGPAPYIIMPFMANGSLLTYLKKNRKSLVISHEIADDYDVEMVRKQLMDMCIQVAKGMEYLASMKVVHRDLAARNCMIDANFVIKVADFGLSESIGVKEYFRQDEDSPVKLPLKWLPPESINDYIFSEKSDVWAYGVTCWEIFSGGRVPYAEVAVREIPKLLADGYRLEKPLNDACSEEMYSFMQQCWSGEPEQRPLFSQLVESLSSSLEGMAGYVHIGAFGIRTQNAPEEPS